MSTSWKNMECANTKPLREVQAGAENLRHQSRAVFFLKCFSQNKAEE